MPEVIPSDISTRPWCVKPIPILGNRYEILGILGQGGMGTVYKGYHGHLKRFVAIKTVRIDKTGPDLVQRFLREMASAGQMDHPNVVRATDAGENSGVLHLVMEFLSGMDLARLVTERGPLQPA